MIRTSTQIPLLHVRQIIQTAAFGARVTIIKQFKVSFFSFQHIAINLEVVVCASISTVEKRSEAIECLKRLLLKFGFDYAAVDCRK